MTTTENKLDLRAIVVLLYAPVALTVFRYFGWPDTCRNLAPTASGPFPQFYYFFCSLLLLGIVPILISRFAFGQRLSEIGLGIGDIKFGAKLIAIGIPLMIILGYMSAQSPSFRDEYPLYRNLLTDKSGLWVYILAYGAYYVGWESFFRGFMLFGLRKSLGDTVSILIQTIPSCLMHIGKPAPEIFGSIAAGLVFGWIALRCRSIWPVFLIHWGLGVSLDLFIIFG